MPIYDYECQTCMKPFEVEARMSDPPPESCPHCQGKSLRRCISRTAFVLKGTGWYTSDYKSSPKDPALSPPSSSTPGDAKDKAPAAPDKPANSPKTESTSSSLEQKPKDPTPKKT